ncbi:glycosyltransferase [Pontibacter qinzhouensis]|uniref:Glycosyltransferase n=1 Tax=Pontibacter qinzhouensis TaxID=2603253 RepID=A0A5C8KCB6_9BACT|nr:glycosyltransferase [Pontibacter qinzhouensis]TXK52122.1 glycosyltransferase [Pontibacter qinzhouensis]
MAAPGLHHYFENTTLLITHYNRSSSLERLLQTFRDYNCIFGDIVVSDDGSKPEHVRNLRALKKEFSFRLLTSPENRGLGHNINKGQAAVKTPYTLYVQEDFVPTPEFTGRFQDALDMMETESRWDLITFYAYIRYPYLKPYKHGFSEKLCKPWYTNYKKIYAYTDHPHLRRSSFLQKFGNYAEGIKGDKTEYKMCVSFIQKKGKGLFYNDFQNLFLQKNSSEEPSTMTRSSWTQNSNMAIALIRDLYRQVKYNYDILFSK